jgi:hypothetical protein
MITVVMYTTEEGEVYVGQVRALGGFGVPSKNVQPRVLFNMLQKRATESRSCRYADCVQLCVAKVKRESVVISAVPASSDQRCVVFARGT